MKKKSKFGDLMKAFVLSATMAANMSACAVEDLEAECVEEDGFSKNCAYENVTSPPPDYNNYNPYDNPWIRKNPETGFSCPELEASANFDILTAKRLAEIICMNVEDYRHKTGQEVGTNFLYNANGGTNSDCAGTLLGFYESELKPDGELTENSKLTKEDVFNGFLHTHRINSCVADASSEEVEKRGGSMEMTEEIGAQFALKCFVGYDKEKVASNYAKQVEECSKIDRDMY